MIKLFLSDEEKELGFSLSLNEQVNVNHAHCMAGEDRKKRLYIKRIEHGLLYYCHHCGQSGVIRNYILKNKYANHSTSQRIHNNTTKRQLTLPTDAESVPAEWPAKARVWCYQYGITDAEIQKYGIVYSEQLRRIVLPIWNNGKLLSYQTRKIFDNDTKPKYLSYGNKDSVFHVKHDDSNKLCLVEDILSSIKTGRYINTMALGKASLSDYQLAWILKKGYKDFVIFLDDDNAQVKKAQIVIKNRLEQFGAVRIIHSNGRDPKEHSDNELIDIYTNTV